MSPNKPKKNSQKKRFEANHCTPKKQTEDGKTPKRVDKRKGTPKRNHDFKPFEPYLTFEDVNDGLKRNTLLKGLLRINQRSYEDAFIDSPDSYGDIHIQGMHNRNRALNGDEVVVQLLPKELWKVDIEAYKREASKDENTLSKTFHDGLKIGNDKKVINLKDDAGQPVKTLEGASCVSVIPDKFYERFGKVVYISELNHSRAAGGHLKPPSKNGLDALFSPKDSRIPRMYIPVSECPDGFINRPDDFSKFLYIARVISWDCNMAMPKGHLQRSLGEAGEIEPETEAILIEHGVDFSEFSEEVLDCLPRDDNWCIPEDEIANRKDLRNECIFTIDPETARDLDDALSCKPTGNGNYEVGVHIADVSYFISENSALDKTATERATSVYLTQKVIPMLPRLLCEKLCSLNPYQDRLAFSFIWILTQDGEIESEWCGRTLIRSCVKLSYSHAQDIIQNPDKVFAENELPDILNNYKAEDIKRCVTNLNKIATNLRRKRFDGGALRLDQPKLSFTLDKETGMPSGYSVYQLRDSNRLVEEFMLLANMAAAVRVYKHYPKRAMLRRHSEPKEKMLDQLVATCAEMGLNIDGTSAGSLQTSLQRYVGEDKFSKTRSQILVNLCSKPMQLAKYFCTGLYEDEYAYRHYALNVPFYTHFTSPIRRYADIVVHRLLAASVNATSDPTTDPLIIEKQAKHCNERKNASKKVQEMSAEIFLAVYVKSCEPLEEDGMVMAVLDRSVDVLIPCLGIVKRAYCNAPEVSDKLGYTYSKIGNRPQLELVWAEDTNTKLPVTKQVLTIFSAVKVILVASDKHLKINIVLKRPLNGEDEPDCHT
ncbi:DIS3-like exonuclease 2 [Antedon mediterranea]|uniref:DIS3-like exonuclease 2 n=1 Tax=Antedon mediterranea TaxID=105859 RepID=UPI003AF63035